MKRLTSRKRVSMTMVRNSQLLLLVCCITMSAGHARAANVESLSNDILEHQGENAFWQAMVKCEGSATSIPIKQALKEQEWCTESSLLSCATSKIRMAQEVCLNLDIFSKPTAIGGANTNRPVSRSQESKPAVSAPTQPARSTWQQTEPNSAERQGLTKASAAINAEERKLQEERRNLEQEKQELAQAERQLNAEAKQLEANLRALEN